MGVIGRNPLSARLFFLWAWQHGGLPFLGAYADIILSKEANETAAEFIRAKIHEIVKDPEIAAMLSPQDLVGCKRLCSDSGYFETFNRANVQLVDVKAAPIEAITASGLRTTKQTYAFDDLILATGFDAMTGALSCIDIRGVGDVTLSERWAEGPRTYLGLSTVGFPNLFMITGPGSPSVLSNMVVSIEQHAEWIAECIAHLRASGLSRIEATPEAQRDWVAHVNGVARSRRPASTSATTLMRARWRAPSTSTPPRWFAATPGASASSRRCAFRTSADR